jgi:hypothetical protein
MRKHTFAPPRGISSVASLAAPEFEVVIVLNLKPVEHCWVAAQATLKRMGKQHGNKPLLI